MRVFLSLFVYFNLPCTRYKTNILIYDNVSQRENQLKFYNSRTLFFAKEDKLSKKYTKESLASGRRDKRKYAGKLRKPEPG